MISSAAGLFRSFIFTVMTVSDRHVRANGVDKDQTAPAGAVRNSVRILECSRNGYILFNA